MKTPDAYHHGHLRAELLRLGLEALESEGSENLSLRSLADQAGVSKTAPYRHFRNKDAFLGALADEGFRLLCEKLEGGGETGGYGSSDGGTSGIVAAMGREYMNFAVSRPALYRIMNSPLNCSLPEEQTTWARRSLLKLAEAVSPASAGIDVDAVAANWAYIHGLVMLRIDGLFPGDLPEPDWDMLAANPQNIGAAAKKPGKSAQSRRAL